MEQPVAQIQIHPQQFKYRWYTLATIMLGLFMAVLDGNIVNVALPHMMAAFSTNTDRIRWVIESYALSYAIFTLTTSWLRERVGIKFTFIAGLVLFTGASMLCAASWNVESIMIFRVIQGIGGGIMMPTGFTLITESFPPQQRGTAFGVFGIVIVFAPTVGPTLGGYIVDSVNWRYIFYINLPVGILTFFLAMSFVNEFKKLVPKTFDFWGFAGLATFLGCLLIALTDGQREGWNSDYILSLFGISILGLLIFLLISPRAKTPILNISLFRNFHFLVIALLNVARSVALFGRMFLLPMFFQNLIGYSARTTGFLLAPGALVSGIVMPLTGPLVDRYGPKIFVFIGLIFFGLSNFMYYNLDVTTPYITILIPIIIYGIGAGMLNTPITTTAMNVVKKEYISQVSTILSVIMQVGGAFGVAMLGTILNNRAAFHQAVYAERLAPYSYVTESALKGMQTLGQRIGESSFLTELQAPAILNMFVSKQAAIAGYQDAFICTGLVCIIALIPALGLLSLKHVRPHKG